MDEMQNPDVVALQSLCDREGGYKAVADVLGVNDQSIYQIVTGKKLPSGRPKGIGPGLRDKLNNFFPGWNATKTTFPNYPGTPSEMALRLAAAFDKIPKSDFVKQARAFSAAVAAIEEVLRT